MTDIVDSLNPMICGWTRVPLWSEKVNMADPYFTILQ